VVWINGEQRSKFCLCGGDVLEQAVRLSARKMNFSSPILRRVTVRQPHPGMHKQALRPRFLRGHAPRHTGDCRRRRKATFAEFPLGKIK
jgi:hypothetical protein